MSATIYDVAHRAGVSIATVSRALNSPHTVSGSTRVLVQEAIDALGYVPRAEATARARRSHRRIGVLAPFFTYWSFVQRLQGIAAALLEADYELIVYNVETPEHVHHYLTSLPVARRLDGLIAISLVLDEAAVDRLLARRLPTVLIEATHPDLSGIDVDNVAGGRLAGDYLVAQGHKAIGFVGGDREVPSYTLHTSLLRLQGLRMALAEARVVLHAAELPCNSAVPEDGWRQALQLLDGPQPPTAIFAASDTLALGVLKAARERNLRVPHDLAIIGFDDLDFATYAGLTTVSQSLEESGRLAVELLFLHLEAPDRIAHHVQLPLKIVRRETA